MPRITVSQDTQTHPALHALGKRGCFAMNEWLTKLIPYVLPGEGLLGSMRTSSRGEPHCIGGFLGKRSTQGGDAKACTLPRYSVGEGGGWPTRALLHDGHHVGRGCARE
jgi:hypothetical protein